MLMPCSTSRFMIPHLGKHLKTSFSLLNHYNNFYIYFFKVCYYIIFFFLMLVSLRFTLDDQATRVSVVQYFRQKYNIVLKYPSWPSLQAGSDSKPIYLPMEVLYLVFVILCCNKGFYSWLC